LFIREIWNIHESPAFIIIYVDDGLIIRTPDLIKTVLKALAKAFKIKYLGPIKSFVGCQILINRARDTICINQPKLIQNLELNFRTLITTDRVFKTLEAPRSVFIRPVKDVDPTIHPDRQFKYRSGVGMLMYLVKHSSRDIANTTRELTKVIYGSTEAHWKAMMRIIKYVFDTNQYTLKLKPYMGTVTLKAISDSEFAGDRETRKSVYCFVTYYCVALIAWKSKSGNSITLSSTEGKF
jgi:hypothetical protein